MPTTIIRCPNCGANNRVALDRTTQEQPICARCKTPLTLQSGPAIVSDATFAVQVEQSPLPVLVDLWAPWCGPCRMIAPIIEKLASDFAGKASFAKLNIDENPATTARFHVEGIPTLLIIKAGREVDRIVGVVPAEEITRRLQKFTA